MDEPKLPIFLHYRFGRTGADDAPVTVDNTHPANISVVVARNDEVTSSANPHQENSHIVFCESEQDIREGFALALRIMGLNQNE
jgi:hypothetical protein